MRKHHFYLLIAILSMPLLAFADLGNASLGAVAGNLLEPVSVFSDFIDTACLILGVSFLFASIIKYVEHKRSPLMVPISTVVFLVIGGVILIALPFLSLVSGFGAPFSFLK